MGEVQRLDAYEVGKMVATWMLGWMSRGLLW